MTDNFPPGAMTMVKIDGAKVKQIREELGLTQLYLATAVQVTTDTISRWENKRYPSIKKENGLKLAEALEVELDALLETSPAISTTQPSDQYPPDTKSFQIKKAWPLLILSATMAAIIGGVGYFVINQTPTVKLSAIRTLPSHYISGQPFPITITISNGPEKSTAIIIRENLPENSVILKTIPEVSAAGTRNTKIKWLEKIVQNELFSYVVKIDENESDRVTFSGSVSMNRSSSDSLTIGGDSEVKMGDHHWADINGDNVISDNEILTVYDRYNDMELLGLDVNLIEEIWLGSGYNWNRLTSSFEIFE